jgi:hypothetical protein
MSQVTEQDAIAAVIQKYVDGGLQGKGSLMRPAFHEGATIFGYLGPDLIAGPIEGLFEWVDAHDPASEVEARVASVDIAGTAASVRVEIDNWSGHQFTDFLSLLKVDGEWKIISKVFYLHD